MDRLIEMDFCAEVDRLDRLPLTAESEFRARLRQLARQVPGQPIEPRQQSAYFRARARLAGMLEQDPLPWARRSLESARHCEQWEEIEQTLQFLRSLQGEVSGQADPDGLESIFSAVLQSAECTSLSQLRQTTLTLMTSLTSLSSCSWHEKSDAHWRCLAWMPQLEAPRVSHQLLDRCAETRQLLLGPAARLGDSPSLALSEVEAATLLPIVRAGRSLAVLYSPGQPRDEELRLLPFLAELTATVMDRLVAEEEANQAAQAAARLNERWREVMQACPVGVAIYTQEGQCLEKNQAFSQYCGEQLPWCHPGQQLRSELVMQRGPAPRWLQVTDWALHQQQRVVRTISDISGDEPDRWVQFLEEFRHQLAADVHDGPAQLAALASMQSNSAEIRESLQRLRRRLNLLRSPWVEQREATTTLQTLLDTLDPTCSSRLDWQVTADRQHSSEVVTACRILQVLVGELARHQPTSIEVGVAGHEAHLAWQGGPETLNRGEEWTWIEHRLELIGGTIRKEPRLLSLKYPATAP